ncbi:MAG: AbrB/MazE/SpoVT family DNA-binding domain-containing protein [Candidatus Micrarchaeota archaeon]
MRFFKHGDSLAIVLPEPLRQKLGVKEDEDFEFIELNDGIVLLVSKKLLSGWAKDKVFSEISYRLKDGAGDKDETLQLLSKQGFFIISRAGEAKALSEKFEQEIKAGNVIGARSFDKTFYIVDKNYFVRVSQKMRKALAARPLTISALADEIKESVNGCKAVVEVLREEGELIEKKKGEFALVS